MTVISIFLVLFQVLLVISAIMKATSWLEKLNKLGAKIKTLIVTKLQTWVIGKNKLRENNRKKILNILEPELRPYVDQSDDVLKKQSEYLEDSSKFILNAKPKNFHHSGNFLAQGSAWNEYRKKYSIGKLSDCELSNIIKFQQIKNDYRNSYRSVSHFRSVNHLL